MVERQMWKNRQNQTEDAERENVVIRKWIDSERGGFKAQR